MDCVSRSGVPLRPHQVKVVEYMMNPKNNGLLVVHFCGMGKSLSAIASSQGFLDLNPTNNIVVICGKSLVPNFKKEMVKYGVKNTSRYNFFTYCKVMYLHKKNKLDQIPCSPTTTMLIIDEAHNLKNYNTATFNAVFRVSTHCRKRLLLTATPFVNSPTDFISPINLIHGRAVVGAKKHFRQGLCNDYMDKNMLSLNNQTMFMKYLDKKVYYLNQSNSDEFPSVQEKYITVDMSPEYERIYAKLIDGESVNSISFDAPEAFYNGHRRAVNTISVEYDNNMNEFTMKLKKMLPILKGGKTMIFTNWIEFGIDAIVQFLRTHNLTFRSLYGQLTQDERAQVVNDYNNNLVDALIITRAGGEGIDLMETKNVIILDPTWNPTTMVQIKSRAIRFKSHVNLPKEEQVVTIYYMALVGKNVKSGDEVLYKIINSKENAKKMSECLLKRFSI
jgi:superfamily II DNA or RNA helicase